MRWGELEKRRKSHARNGLTKTEWQREHSIVKNTDKSADDFQKSSKVAKLMPLLTFRKKLKE